MKNKMNVLNNSIKYINFILCLYHLNKNNIRFLFQLNFSIRIEI